MSHRAKSSTLLVRALAFVAFVVAALSTPAEALRSRLDTAQAICAVTVAAGDQVAAHRGASVERGRGTAHRDTLRAALAPFGPLPGAPALTITAASASYDLAPIPPRGLCSSGVPVRAVARAPPSFA